MKISLIAAIGKNRELGKDNKLLWNIPEDLKHFKEITSGHVVVMGRKTFESIGRPLPKRTNIVITRDTTYHQEGVIICHSLKDALEEAKNREKDEIMIIGGGQIFEQALGLADRIYLTLIDTSFDADSFFPDYSQFSNIVRKEDSASEGYRYSFLVLEK